MYFMKHSFFRSSNVANALGDGHWIAGRAFAVNQFFRLLMLAQEVFDASGTNSQRLQMWRRQKMSGLTTNYPPS
jgi:hypothetical protein